MIDITVAILILGASVSAELTGVPSPGRLIAERMGAPFEIVARSGGKLEAVLPRAEAKVREAALVVSVDGLHWNGTDRICDDGLAAANRLFDLRAGKPMILAGVQESAGLCAAPLNALLVRRCVGQCILVMLEGDLKPVDLHPDETFMRRFVAKVYAK